MRLRLMLLVCAALALTVGVTAAFSATTTIGQTGAPADTFFFGGDQIVPDGYVVPAGGGVIVSLNTQSASSCNTSFGFAQGTYNLQVLRPMGGGQYTVLGATGHQTDPCARWAASLLPGQDPCAGRRRTRHVRCH